MTARIVVGIFGSTHAAEQARTQLAESGVPAERVTLSVNLMEDGIAAEAPGQSYEHQSPQGSEGADEAALARYNTAVRTGACLLSVSSESGVDLRRIEELLHRKGARITMQRPPQ